MASKEVIALRTLPMNVQALLKPTTTVPSETTAVAENDPETVKAEARECTRLLYDVEHAEDLQLSKREEKYKMVWGNIVSNDIMQLLFAHKKDGCDGRIQSEFTSDGLAFRCQACAAVFPRDRRDQVRQFLPVAETFKQLREYLQININITDNSQNTTNNNNNSTNQYITNTSSDIEHDSVLCESTIVPLLARLNEQDYLLCDGDKALSDLIASALHGYANEIGKVMYHIGKNRFGVEDRKWWAWNENLYLWVKDGTLPRVFCKENVTKVFKEAAARVKNTELLSADEKVLFAKLIEAIIRRVTDKELPLILEHTMDHFKINEPHFVNKLDANKDILAFKGEIYDFKTQTVRPIQSDDYVSKSCGYSIQIEEDKEVQDDIMRIIGETVENRETLDHLFTIIASCLDGHNAEEHATLLTGELGRNGKTNLSNLILNALGGDRVSADTSYAYCPAASFLTSERPSSSKPCPDLLHLKGKRIVIMSEPPQGQSINNAFFKFITGNDRIEGRWCHGNESEVFSPQHSVFLLCNKPPAMDADDNAAWERMSCVEFPYTFIEHPSEEKAYEKKRDVTLKAKLASSKYGEQFMLMMLNKYYPLYRKHGITAPDTLIKKVKELRLGNDSYATFVNAHLRKTDNEDDRVLYPTIVESYQKWAQGEGITMASFKAKMLKTALVQFIGRDYTTILVDGKIGRGWKYSKIDECY